MMFAIQLKKQPNRVFLVRATSRLDAFNLIKVYDVPKRVWELTNFDTSQQRESVSALILQ